MLLRPCVVIPCFDNPATIADVVRRALASCPFPLLVVDDGSRLPVEELLHAEGISDPRLEVHRFARNEGKGMALRFALNRCVERGFTHMITLDADGQHFPEDIPLFAEELRRHPFRLLIGDRKMDQSAPGISHFGRKFSNFWVRYQAGADVADSQSGFRAYPLFPLQTTRFLCRRFDFEIEILVRALWRGVEVSNLPIRVLYQPKGERVSHFHKLRDNARISALNCLLVALALCRRGLEPVPVALATGLGVLVGCTPFFGLHTAIVVALALAFRLNAPLMWLGSQVSIPPLAPFLAVASIFLGSRLLGQPVPFPEGISGAELLEFARQSFLAWLAGSLVLGAGLGAIAGCGAFFLACSWKAKAGARKNWTGETRGGRAGNAFLVLVLKRFGLRAGYLCLAFVVPYFYLFAPKARQALDEYWRVVRPGAGWLARQRRIYLHLRAFARVLMDRIYQLQHGREHAFERRSTGFGAVRDALEAGRGVLLAGAHAGNNDLAVNAFHAHGLRRRFHVLQHEAQRLTFSKVAGEKGRDLVDIIYVGDRDPAVFRVQQVLGQGDMLGLMADRPLDHKFELVPFFGRLAPVATSPFRIALATGAELAFTFGFKAGDHAYEYSCVRPEPPSPAAAADKDLAAHHYAREYARALEAKLREHPEQWFNFYRFFTLPPTLPTGEPCRPRSCRLWSEPSAP